MVILTSLRWASRSSTFSSLTPSKTDSLKDLSLSLLFSILEPAVISTASEV